MQRLNIFCSLGCIIIAFFGLIGYMFDFVLFSSVYDEYIPMAPSTAISFILTGMVIYIHNLSYRVHYKVYLISLLLLFPVMLHGLLATLSAVTTVDLRLGHYMLSDHRYFQNVEAGFMSPLTGALFFLSGLSLIILFSQLHFFKRHAFGYRLAEIIGIICLTTSATYCLSYFYGHPFLYGYDVVPMALNTAISFILLSIPIINFDNQSLLYSLFFNNSIAAIIMRYFLPFILLVFFITTFGMGKINEIAPFNSAYSSLFLLSVIILLITYISNYIARLTGYSISNYRIKNRELKNKLINNENLLKLCIESAKIGVWEYDINHDSVSVSDNLNTIFGERHSKIWTFNSFISSIYKEDRTHLIDVYNKVISPGNEDSFYVQCRKYWSNKSLHWYEFFGEIAAKDEHGNATKIRGAMMDITDKKIVSDEVENFFSMPRTLNLICSFEGNIINVNDTWHYLMGYELEDLKHTNILELVHPNERNTFNRYIRKIIQTMKPEYFSTQLRCHLGKYLQISWSASVSITSGQLYFIGIDNTEFFNSQKALSNSLFKTIEAIAATVDKRDPYTSGHMSKVAVIAAAIAKEMGLPKDKIEGIRIGASIHDIGKIYIPAEILNRPGKLSTPEYDLIKTHPKVGYDIIKNIAFPWPVPEMILQHHEKLNGSGYPKGLKGNEIIIESQILTVADVIEATTSHRPYRPALPLKQGIDVLLSGKGELFNADAVDACIKLINEDKINL